MKRFGFTAERRRRGRQGANREMEDIMNPLQALAEQGQAVWLDFLSRDIFADGELATADRGGRPRRRHLQSVDLREGDRRERRRTMPTSRGSSARARPRSARSTNGSPSRIFRRRRPTAPGLRAHRGPRTASSASKCRPISPSIPRRRSRRRGVCGTRSAARTSWSRCRPPPRGCRRSASLSPRASTSTSRCCSRSRSTRRWPRPISPAWKTALRGGKPIGRIASVASFFVSRIDTAVDKLIDQAAARSANAAERAALETLRGKAAIANAKLAYRAGKRIFSGARWERLRKEGARPQQLLWASTGTKNPAYSDVLYVEKLIGPDTVNTMPEKTMDAFRDHGKVRDTLDRAMSARPRRHSRRSIAPAFRSTRSPPSWSSTACRLFADAFDKLIAAVAGKRRARARQDAQRADADASRAASRRRSAKRGKGLACAKANPPPVERGRDAVDRRR